MQGPKRRGVSLAAAAVVVVVLSLSSFIFFRPLGVEFTLNSKRAARELQVSDECSMSGTD